MKKKIVALGLAFFVSCFGTIGCVNAQLKSKKWYTVEVSHFNDKIGSNDNKLKYGDFAFPKGIPYGTKFIIEYADGSREEGVVRDVMGTPKPKLYKDAVMRIDKHAGSSVSRSELRKLGVIKAKIYIVEWGK